MPHTRWNVSNTRLFKGLSKAPHPNAFGAPQVLLWLSLVLLSLALMFTVLVPLAKFIWDFSTLSQEARPSIGAVGHAVRLSLELGLSGLLFQLLLAAHLGRLLSATRASARLILLFGSPLFVGPTVSALLWKLLVSPGNGLIAQLLADTRFTVPDWSQSLWEAPLVIDAVQIWTWGLVAGAGVAVLFDDNAEKARALYLLDGGRRLFANFWALWMTRREWLVVLVLVLVVENFRSFETIYVLTNGGPGRGTGTVAYLVFENGFLTTQNPGSSGIEAAWILVLIGMNAVVSYCFFKMAFRGISSD